MPSDMTNPLLRDPLSQEQLLRNPLAGGIGQEPQASEIARPQPRSNGAVEIICIGEAMVELSCDGDVRTAKTLFKSFGGDTLNTAVAAQRLGSKTAYVTRLGQDPIASLLKDTISQEGIDTSLIKTMAGQTGLYICSVDKSGQRSFQYYRKQSPATTLSPDDLNPNMIANAQIVFSSGITLAISDSARQTVKRAFEIARENNVMTALDINYRESLWKNPSQALDAYNDILPLVDVVLPSAPEDTKKLIGFWRPDQVVEYYRIKEVPLVVVKAGDDGCYIGFKKDIAHIPALPMQAVDTTGAGDAFNGGFLHGLATSCSLMDCGRLGVTTAGLKIMARGTIDAMPYKDSVYNRVF